MIGKKLRILILMVCSLCLFACQYIVIPDDIEFPDESGAGASGTWNAFVTAVSTTDAGVLHIEITIQNNTGIWSTMRSLPDAPAVLTTGDGTKTDCDTVFIGTGGHRFPPGFQMRGYTAKVDGKIQTQILFVECQEGSATPGSKLTIKYESFGGILDDYDPEADKTTGTFELALDDIASDLTYPVASPVEGLVLPSDSSITGLSENVVTLLDAQRVDDGLQFTWQNFNPTKFALKTHIGIPPVIGDDGILYGVYEILDMAPVPITPAKENIEWTTEVKVPQTVKGLYILLSVESNKPRTYLNYVLDITSK